MRLFVVETIRFWSRRITWVTLLVSALAMLLAVGIAFTQVSGEPPAERELFDTQCVEFELESWRNGGWAENGIPGESPFEDMSEEEFRFFLETEVCRDWSNPDKRFWAVSILGFETDDWSENRHGTGPSFDFERDRAGNQIRLAKEPLPGILPGIATAFLLISVVLGASFMGAEYRSGTVENLLLWEPRRGRLLLTKYAAGFVSSFIATALAMSFLAGLLLLLANFRGTYTGVDGRFWIDLASVIFRASLVGGVFFVLAMAIATLSKHTTAAVVAILGWFVLTNVLIQLIFKSVRQYELFINAVAFIGEGDAPKLVKGSSYDIFAYSHGYLAAGGVVAIWGLIIGGIALLVFRRRDLT